MAEATQTPGWPPPDSQASAAVFSELAGDLEWQERYGFERLPTHAAAWELALDALARLGRPMIYRIGSRPAMQAPFSTGLHLLETSEVALRIILDGVGTGAAAADLTTRALGLLRQHPEVQDRRAALEVLAPYVLVEAWTVVPLSAQQPRGAERYDEVDYPTTIGDRPAWTHVDADQILDNVFGEGPDPARWVRPLAILGAAATYKLERPTMPPLVGSLTDAWARTDADHAVHLDLVRLLAAPPVAEA